MVDQSTNQLAVRLLDAHEDLIPKMVPGLMTTIANELGLPPIPVEQQWPADIVEVIQHFYACVTSGELDRLRKPGGVFERLGAEAARGGLDPDDLERGIRRAAVLMQGQTHRVLLASPEPVGQEVILDLLQRVLVGAEAVIEATRQGYATAGLVSDGDAGTARQLGAELVANGAAAGQLAERLGWAPDSLVCAILTTAEGSKTFAAEGGESPAYYARTDGVVLALPVPPGRLATSLRPRLAGMGCAVGPAVPMGEFRDSLALAKRMRDGSSAAVRSDPVFADEALLELACVADPTVIHALRRKYFTELDALPDDVRASLVETLHQWLLLWGHRPSIATALDIHAQTVSGRLHKLRNLLADDLEDPTVRAELLVLLTAENLPR